MTPPLGLVEGYYGKPWSWQEREATIAFLKPHGYDFYIYAPKADAHLRKLWRERHREETAEALRRLAARCRELDVRFGVGLSPFELYRDFNAEAKTELSVKLAQFEEWAAKYHASRLAHLRVVLPNPGHTQGEYRPGCGAGPRAPKPTDLPP